MARLLDRFLPAYDFVETHATHVDAEPHAVLSAVRELRGRDSPTFVVLMSLRGLPRLLARRRAPRWGRPIVEGFEAMGFALLGEREGELALGGVGRFWRADGGVLRLSAEEFELFAEPGYAKAAVDFRALPERGGTLLTTETRVLLTDAAARRAFRRYWRLVRPGSAAIRRAWLRAIKRAAERR